MRTVEELIRKEFEAKSPCRLTEWDRFLRQYEPLPGLDKNDSVEAEKEAVRQQNRLNTWIDAFEWQFRPKDEDVIREGFEAKNPCRLIRWDRFLRQYEPLPGLGKADKVKADDEAVRQQKGLETWIEACERKYHPGVSQSLRQEQS